MAKQIIDWGAPVDQSLDGDELHRVCVFCTNVRRELTEMKKLGMRVPKGALTAAFDIKAMQRHIHMSVSGCADLLIDLN